jgi:hypothetical protein
MKNIFYRKGLSIALMLLVLASCTENFEEINTDPNNPTKVDPAYLMSNAQKGLLDDIYDEWFSGRQSYLYAQYFAQLNYTEEDRYQLRQPTNSTYWTYIYGDVMDLVEVIRLNEELGDEGNINQIAAARILKAWAMQILTDTYGDIPYFEAFKAEGDVSPAYTPQNEIYADLIKELTEASSQIDVSKPVFTSGDIIYNGDAVKWRKFANSLKMRVALRMSKVDSNYKSYIDQAIASGVFESNADNAVFRYLSAYPNAAPLYDAFHTAKRNDFSLSKPFVDLLKGVNDGANGKVNPFNGLFDPRLAVWADTLKGQYNGMPYGIPNDITAVPRANSIDLTKGGIVTKATLALTYMDYSEVCFILSEVNNWDQEWYEKGVTASLEYWKDEGAEQDELPDDYDDLVETYLGNLPSATEETVLTQKYIALFLQGYEAWAELRRTGFPKTVVRPGEISYVTSGGTAVKFEPLVGDDIPSRINYPEAEQNLNQQNYKDAVARMGADNLQTKVWWNQ